MEKIEKLIQYYKEKGLLIVGLNDSQGVNTTSTFFKNGLLEYLAAALTTEDLKPEVIKSIVRSLAIGHNAEIFNGYTTIEDTSDFLCLDIYSLQIAQPEIEPAMIFA